MDWSLVAAVVGGLLGLWLLLVAALWWSRPDALSLRDALSAPPRPGAAAAPLGG